MQDDILTVLVRMTNYLELCTIREFIQQTEILYHTIVSYQSRTNRKSEELLWGGY